MLARGDPTHASLGRWFPPHPITPSGLKKPSLLLSGVRPGQRRCGGQAQPRLLAPKGFCGCHAQRANPGAYVGPKGRLVQPSRRLEAAKPSLALGLASDPATQPTAMATLAIPLSRLYACGATGDNRSARRKGQPRWCCPPIPACGDQPFSRPGGWRPQALRSPGARAAPRDVAG